ncbi:hypothetical protein QR680_008847 [Steinernema hermaphroditum]|uniref:G-protein coupled receptors family 1 profile domain-containing protein n=1 Tax=Steinernema hermaphroditum TaxID=289476 RepID=A0AA39M8U7_9BILA|nr:hypothetical protein QR680_008847 [Steinernema hermaphroditum]
MTSSSSDDMIVGYLIIVLSVLCFIPNVVIMTAIYRDKELRTLNSYKLMMFLGVFDMSQLVVHFTTGFFNLFQNVGHPIFAKCLGVVATPSYICYVVITIVLAFNRFTQLACPKIDGILFGPGKLKYWMVFCLSFFLAFALALASPWATIHYVPEEWSWSYDYSLTGSKTIQMVEMVIELGGIAVSFLIYTGVFVVLWHTRKRFTPSAKRAADLKILIQSGVITAYCTTLNFMWHNYELILPDSLGTYCGLNFMWILNGGVNPIVYVIVNAAIRRKATVRLRSKRTTSKVDPGRPHSQTVFTVH